jgi:hypothetical protein
MQKAALLALTVSLLPVLDAQPGPAAGSRAPDFQALDQDSRSRTLQKLMGPKGLMLVFYRSADW